MPIELKEPEGPASSRTIPLNLAHERVRELGGLDRVADRLQMSPRNARALLTSERPLPAWVTDVLLNG